MRSSFLAFVGLSFIGSVFGSKPKKPDPVETAFEDLKEQLCGSKKAPFYVICVMRDGPSSINQVDIAFLIHVLKKIITDLDQNSISELTNALNDVQRVDYARHVELNTNIINPRDEDIQTFLKENQDFSYLLADFNLKKITAAQADRDPLEQHKNLLLTKKMQTCKQLRSCHSGFVIFNEYFFGGTNGSHNAVMPERQALNLTRKFSEIDPHMVWMCNFLMQPTQKNNFKEIFLNAKKIDNNENQKCETNIIDLNDELYSHKLSNTTLYGHNGIVFASYNKRTYCYENDEFLRQNEGNYEFGSGNLMPIGSDKLCKALEQVIQPYICADYKYVAFDNFTNKKFLILQSNSKKTSLEIYNEDLFVNSICSDIKNNQIYTCLFPQSFSNYLCIGMKESDIVERIKEYIRYTPRSSYSYIIHADPKFVLMQPRQKRNGAIIVCEGTPKSKDNDLQVKHCTQITKFLETQKKELFQLRASYGTILAGTPIYLNNFSLNMSNYTIEIYEIK